MFMREGIVCAVLCLPLLGPSLSACQNKPPDLPLDPRVVCPEGQDAVPPIPPAAEQVPPSTSDEGAVENAQGVVRLNVSDKPIFDPAYLEMLQSTEPLNLPPIDPVANDIRQVNSAADERPSEGGYVLRAVYERRAEHESTNLLRWNPSAVSSTLVPLPDARRNCCRTNVAGTTLYVEPAPRSLKIREE